MNIHEVVNLKTIGLDDIDAGDSRFRISFFYSLESLLLSIKRVGLLHPPLVTVRDGRLVLVSGWKRFLACKELKFPKLNVLVETNTDDLKIFLVALYENLGSREFTILEKAEIISKLKRFGEDPQNIIRQYLPLLMIPAAASAMDLYTAISDLDMDTKKTIHEKEMSLAAVQKLVEFKPEERRLIVPLLRPLSQNKQREILEALQEISGREGRSAGRILSAKNIEEILGAGNLSDLQKSEQVRSELKKRRYPMFSFWTNLFRVALKKIHWPREVDVEPSPFFEEDHVSFHFQARNGEELRSLIARIQAIAAREEVESIFPVSFGSASRKKKKSKKAES
jgi:ParB family chromosome partitioning protein